MTPWWLIPIFWIPIISYQLYCINNVASPIMISTIIFGFISWTFIEYCLHRFLFHCEDLGLFPRNTKVYAIHFLVHGIHHAFP